MLLIRSRRRISAVKIRFNPSDSASEQRNDRAIIHISLYLPVHFLRLCVQRFPSLPFYVTFLFCCFLGLLRPPANQESADDLNKESAYTSDFLFYFRFAHHNATEVAKVFRVRAIVFGVNRFVEQKIRRPFGNDRM